jgi:hypothetical protein
MAADMAAPASATSGVDGRDTDIARWNRRIDDERHRRHPGGHIPVATDEREGGPGESARELRLAAGRSRERLEIGPAKGHRDVVGDDGPAPGAPSLDLDRALDTALDDHDAQGGPEQPRRRSFESAFKESFERGEWAHRPPGV